MRSWALVLLLLFPGCGLGPAYTPEEVAWKQQMDRENWRLCEAVYRAKGGATIHRGHSHQKGRQTRIGAVRTDLSDNQCRLILGPYWAE